MKLTEAGIKDTLRQHPGWTFDDNAFARTFTFPDFADAVAFVTRLGFDAEAADHHPDLAISYRKVTVSWSTHSEGGVTEKDVAGIAAADRVATRFGA